MTRARDSFFLPYATTDLRDVKRCTLVSKRGIARYSGSVSACINRLIVAISTPNSNAASFMVIKSLSSISDQVNVRVILCMIIWIGYFILHVLSMSLPDNASNHLTTRPVLVIIYLTQNSPTKRVKHSAGPSHQER